MFKAFGDAKDRWKIDGATMKAWAHGVSTLSLGLQAAPSRSSLHTVGANPDIIIPGVLGLGGEVVACK